MPPLSCTNVTQTVAEPAVAVKREEDNSDDTAGSSEQIRDFCDAEAESQDANRKGEVNGDVTLETASPSSRESSPVKIVWRNVILFAYLHLAALYGLYLMFVSAKWQTNVFAFFLYITSGLGVTAGAHRLWSHRSYKARLPLRILLAFVYTIAFENDIYEWARDHRVHHKYSETDADPHNAKRGFFFAHIGWLLCRKHPDVIKRGKAIDLSDLMADPVVRFHRKHYLKLVVPCCFVIPTLIPMYCWRETFLNSFLIATLFRLCFTLNQTWLVNSAAHMWGTQPYDITINPRQNALTVLGAVGEGFHNYHHTFPYDYATSEYGIKYNLTTAFINTMAFLGLAYDLKTASKGAIEGRKARTGVNSELYKKRQQEAKAVKENLNSLILNKHQQETEAVKED
ncbi:stearoyl-CoA desaturase 5-like [Stegodyphus dumicola]|uniref:stearoyl-CoA desaturase 5-like n=1 Tax=Stegodyphus dumicola TaxID=202533 RepID=UPI0015A901D7|nr:stearoyl-CoA desaturase 5-like [Stegodyphus dumicola]XP_035224765.1 stearoyl-CoA desaturase 5-like [Stegodyphus dumicola]XP_035224825.1 stearoyl-CoA desaturase 5-like [Stegodyphus dumicola]XP_035224879.1 stearoyl-CoA desaturase 5-like [Stegodyphus dumicola]